MLSETCPSINSPDCGFDRGAAMRVSVIEMRVLEDKRWRLCLLPVRRSRIPMSYSTPWLGSSRLSVRAPVSRLPNVCQLDSCTVWFLLSLQMPENRSRQLQKLWSRRSFQLSTNPSRQRHRVSSLMASPLHKRLLTRHLADEQSIHSVRVTRPFREAAAWFLEIMKHWFLNSSTGCHRQPRLTYHQAQDAIPRYSQADCRSHAYNLELTYMCTSFHDLLNRSLAFDT
jgi:hypothetical protein